MRQPSIPYIKLDRVNESPTVQDSMWGQIRWKVGDGATVQDRVVFIGKDESGDIIEYEFATVPDVDAISDAVSAVTTDAVLGDSLSTSGPPPSTSVGAAAGTGGSVGSVIDFGNSISGRVVVTAGTSALTTGVLATITFSSAKPDTNYSVQLTAMSSVAAGSGYYVTGRTTTKFEIGVTVAPGSGDTLSFSYLVIEDD